MLFFLIGFIIVYSVGLFLSTSTVKDNNGRKVSRWFLYHTVREHDRTGEEKVLLPDSVVTRMLEGWVLSISSCFYIGIGMTSVPFILYYTFALLHGLWNTVWKPLEGWNILNRSPHDWKLGFRRVGGKSGDCVAIIFNREWKGEKK